MQKIIRFVLFTLCACGTSQETHLYQNIPDLSELPLLNPDLQERKSAKIRLQNGLEALLISDPGADQSSASLVVGAGSWNDPDHYPGMAHFCEHMLFMGSAKYPDPQGFMNHVSDFGGVTNAYTASERTVYMFSCKHEGFGEALSRFSRFFIDPLFDPAHIARELHAIDQEYAKNLENDRWREYMVFKELGNPNHPVRKFSSGNSQTLAGIPKEALQDWHGQHYDAQTMHLFLYSNLSIEEMKREAVHLFSEVPALKQAAEPVGEGLLTSDAQRGHIAYIEPLQERQTIDISWELPPFLAEDETQTAELIAYALRRGQLNSLYEKLKKEELIDHLSIAVEALGGKKHQLFHFSMDLTAIGVKHVEKAVLRCFEALEQLKREGIPAYLFDEKNAIAKLGYQYQTRQDAFHMAMSMGDSISNEPLATFPREELLGSSHSPEKIQQVLACLSPENAYLAFSIKPSISLIKSDTKERWFGAKYAVRPIPSEWLALWKNSQPNPDIAIAKPNPFIPSQLQLVPLQNGAATPVLLSKSEKGIAYYCRSPEFLAPEAAIHLYISSPRISDNAKSSVLLSLYLDHLTDLLHPTLAAAKSAGLSTQFDLEKLKLHIQIFGFSEKAPLLLREILLNLAEKPPTKEQFDLYVARHAKAYANVSKNLAASQAKELMESLLMSERTSSAEKLTALQLVDYKEFVDFHRTLFDQTYAEALFTGNLTEAQARASWLSVEEAQRSAYPISAHLRPKVLDLPSGDGPFSLARTTDVQGNATLLAIDEGPFSFESRGAQDILAAAMREAFFNELRSKQKTGYIAKADPMEIEGKLFHLFMVQSNSHQPADLLYRFELFFEEFLQTLSETLPPTRFETLKHSCIHSLQTRFRNLKDKSALWNLLAFEKRGDFLYIEKRLKTLQSLTYEEFCQFVNEKFSRSNTRRLAVLYEGRLAAPFAYEVVDTPQLLEKAKYTALCE